jgi:hypothetical protein
MRMRHGRGKKVIFWANFAKIPWFIPVLRASLQIFALHHPQKWVWTMLLMAIWYDFRAAKSENFVIPGEFFALIMCRREKNIQNPLLAISNRLQP